MQVEAVPESLARRFGMRIQGLGKRIWDKLDLATAIIREHARLQMGRRQIDEAVVRRVLGGPESVSPEREGRVAAQAVVDGYSVRVFVDVDRRPFEVVTAYRTSKIEKYRS